MVAMLTSEGMNNNMSYKIVLKKQKVLGFQSVCADSHNSQLGYMTVDVFAPLNMW